MRLALILALSATLATPSLAGQTAPLTAWHNSAVHDQIARAYDGNRGGRGCKPPKQCTER